MNNRIIHVKFVFHYVAIGIPNILINSYICNGKDSRGCCLNNFWIDYLFSLHTCKCWFSDHDVLNYLLHLAHYTFTLWRWIWVILVLRQGKHFAAFIVWFWTIIRIWSEKWFSWFTAVCESFISTSINNKFDIVYFFDWLSIF